MTLCFRNRHVVVIRSAFEISGECGESHDAGQDLVNDGAVRSMGEVPAPEQRDRVIRVRKTDLIDGLVAEGRLDAGGQAAFRRLARGLGAVFHYQYFEELDRLREVYFHFDPEIDPETCGPAPDLDAAYRRLSEEVIRVLTEANFIEITHGEIIQAFAEPLDGLNRHFLADPRLDVREVETPRQPLRIVVDSRLGEGTRFDILLAHQRFAHENRVVCKRNAAASSLPRICGLETISISATPERLRST